MHKSELIPSEDRRLIAVYVYFRFPFAMHHPAGLGTVHKSIIITLHQKKTKNGKIALEFYNRITPQVWMPKRD